MFEKFQEEEMPITKRRSPHSSAIITMTGFVSLFPPSESRPRMTRTLFIAFRSGGIISRVIASSRSFTCRKAVIIIYRELHNINRSKGRLSRCLDCRIQDLSECRRNDRSHEGTATREANETSLLRSLISVIISGEQHANLIRESVPREPIVVPRRTLDVGRAAFCGFDK